MKQRSIRFVLFSVLMLTGVLFIPSKPAQACPSCTGDAAVPIIRNTWPETYRIITERITTEFTSHRTWLVTVFWEDNVLPAMMLMADQLTAVAMQQTYIFGTFFDAKHQLETQQSLQKIVARAHKDYHPSAGMCEFGTGVKSLAASERKGEYNAIVLSQRAQDRAVGSANTSASGNSMDEESRIRQFRKKFCNPKDNNNGLALMCDHNQVYNEGAMGAEQKERMNKDIDFVRTVYDPLTLDVDLTNAGDPTAHEEEVFALASNLYGQKVFFRPPPSSLESLPNEDLRDMQGYYLDARAVMAKRSVAENSFNALIGLKSAGAPGSRDYIKAVLQELGVSNASAGPAQPSDIDQILGANPSYFAQMEVLTKKIYQNPDFYTNLYDKPANVARKQVALQAIGLMQKFDLFKSYLRNEASLSVLLELAVTDLQIEAENKMGGITGFGETAKP